MPKQLKLFLMSFLGSEVLLMGATSYKAFNARARNRKHACWGWKMSFENKEYATQIANMKSLPSELLKGITVSKTELIELGLKDARFCKVRSFYAAHYADLETASLRKCKTWTPLGG